MGQGTKARVWATPRALAAALILAGCGGGDVWVGQFQEGLNLDTCAGTTCDLGAPRELTMPEPRACDAELGPSLETDLSVAITLPACSMFESCFQTLVDLAVAPDGSSWVLVRTYRTIGTGEDKLWLVRVDSEGEPLSTTSVANGISFNGGSVGQSASIATDQRGHAFVLVYQIDPGPNADAPIAERAWFTELDTDGEVVTGPIELAGIGAGRIAVREDGDIMIAASALQRAPRSIVAALTRTGERLWSRADLVTGDPGGYGGEGAIFGLGVDTSGAALVFARRQRFPSGNTNDDIYGLTRFDSEGNAEWDVVLGHLAAGAFAPGSNGDALIHGHTLEGTQWFGYVRADGTAPWAYSITAWFGGGVVDTEHERVYVVGTGEAPESQVLAAVTLDGETCERYAMPDGRSSAPRIDALGRLYTIDDGRVIDGKAVGLLIRMRLPEE